MNIWNIPEWLESEVWARDKTCVYCGVEMLQSVPQGGSRRAAATWEHICRSPNSSIDKARRLLGYEPRYTSLEAVYESVTWLIEHGVVEAR